MNTIGRKKAKTKRLDELEQSGFIMKVVSSHKDYGAYYKVIDEYSLFYLSWVEPSKKARLAKNYWQGCVKSGAYHAWSGYAFEAVCEKHLDQICHALEIPDGSLAMSWRFVGTEKQPGAQIDLLFIRPDNIIQICEIKFTNTPFIIDKEYAEKLQQKIDVYQKITKSKETIFISFISANGLKETRYARKLVDSIATIDNLFS